MPTLSRLYRSRFKGQPLLVCRKCERKLDRDDPLARLKKAFKKLTKADPDCTRIYTIPVSCLKLCPEGGVVVCTQAQLAQTPPSLQILRSKDDLLELFTSCKAHPQRSL